MSARYESRAKMVPVATPMVADVRIKRHVLDIEAARLAHLARRVGQRLRRTLLELPEKRIALQILRDGEGPPVTTPMLDADGKPILEQCLPSEDWLEHFRWYQNAIFKLLQEQRMRAGMKDGKPPMSDEDYEREMAELAQETVREMPRAELEQLLRERSIEVSETKANDDTAACSPDAAAIPEASPLDSGSGSSQPDGPTFPRTISHGGEPQRSIASKDLDEKYQNFDPFNFDGEK